MFEICRRPELLLGAGSLMQVVPTLRRRGLRRVLFIAGPNSGPSEEERSRLESEARDAGVHTSMRFKEGFEAAVSEVDALAAGARSDGIGAVVALGGGGVIDTGKAVAVMLAEEGSIRDLLEGVGTRPPSGARAPFIAVPATAGTGSEATKNAVISEVGRSGYKKSLRHDNFVPDIAILDPRLILRAPRAVQAASGLDAITQLLEAFVSTKAGPYTDALARSGLKAAGGAFTSLLRASPGRPESENALGAAEAMAWAAHCSGICLANAGLGVVHGIASPVGARFPIPHGQVCGKLLLPSVRLTLERLAANPRVAGEGGAGKGGAGELALEKYAEAGYLLSDRPLPESGPRPAGLALLEEQLDFFDALAELPGFADYGLAESDCAELAGESGLKNHPVSLSSDEITELLRRSM